MHKLFTQTRFSPSPSAKIRTQTSLSFAPGHVILLPSLHSLSFPVCSMLLLLCRLGTNTHKTPPGVMPLTHEHLICLFVHLIHTTTVWDHWGYFPSAHENETMKTTEQWKPEAYSGSGVCQRPPIPTRCKPRPPASKSTTIVWPTPPLLVQREGLLLLT